MSGIITTWLGGYIVVWLMTHLILRILWFPRWIGECHWEYSNNEVREELNNSDEENDTAIELLSAEYHTGNTTSNLRRLESTQHYSSTLNVDWCRIQWETTRQFKCLYRLIRPLHYRHRYHSNNDVNGNRYTWLWSYWFDMGILWGGLLMPIAIMTGILMSIQLISRMYYYYSSNPTNNHNGSTVLLVTALPGFNLPWSHLPLQLIAICIATLWHEIGHALAAIQVCVPIRQVGVFFWFIYPGAYVKVDARVLVQVSIRKQLRILLAGVWHNLVLVAVVMLLLASGLLDIPWSWLGWERANSGVAITDIVTTSPLSSIIPVGSLITRVDQTILENGVDSWFSYLASLAVTTHSFGYCWRNSTWQQEPKYCCQSITDKPSTSKSNGVHWCFTESINTTNICVPVVNALPRATACTDKQPCTNTDDICFYPRLDSKQDHLLRIYYTPPLWVENNRSNDNRTNTTHELMTVWIGKPIQLYHQLRVGYWQPKLYWLPISLPELPKLSLRYIAAYSAGIGLLNVAPVYGLDGQPILELLLSLVTVSSTKWTRYILTLCTGLFIFVIIGSLIGTYFS